MSEAVAEGDHPTLGSDDDDKSNCKGSRSTEERVGESRMDMDVDLDACWPFDGISFAPNSVSPLILSTSSDQPFSPLWAFSDIDVEDVHASSAPTPSLSDSYRLLSSTPFPSSEKQTENHQSHKLPSSSLPLIPFDVSDTYFLIKERMTQALRYFKDLTEQNVLAQVWAPIRNGNHFVLTTSGQPFIIGPHSNGLHQYRTVSVTYLFSVDGDHDAVLGLPGRVFRHKLPEWTPNVQYYSSTEYPRRNYAERCNVRGTLALPVFEPSGQSCVGVLELIMNSQKVNYAPEVDKICKALEAVNLKSSQILDHPNIQICNEGRQNALAEILEILTVLCETHKVPLAQTWVPCRHRTVLAHGGGIRKSCSSFDGCCMGQLCMSTTDAAFYVVDAHMWGFREACVEHHLQHGQGVAGRAFLSQNLCFCANVTKFCKTEYPLVHYALLFGLTSCFSICLRSNHTGNDDYILEFFLPHDITDSNAQMTLLGSLLATMKQNLRSLRVASGVELEDYLSVEVIEARNGGVYSSFKNLPIAQGTGQPDALSNQAERGPLDSTDQAGLYFNAINRIDNVADHIIKNADQSSSLEMKTISKPSERKRGKTEKSISLEVLQKYFAGSLKDAAKSLGVCPTTMKRICRQHGISRWPSRKIRKVNRSLSKLKRVIESVQGAEGALSLNSLGTNPLPINVSAAQPSSSNLSNQPASPYPKGSEPVKEKGNELHKFDVSEYNGQAEVSEQHTCVKLGDPKKLNCQKSVALNRSRTGSGSSEDSADPTSHGSCQGSPPKEISPVEQTGIVGGSPDLTLRPTDETAACLPIADVVRREFFGGMQLIEDSGSSKDLRNLCPAVADTVLLDDQVPETGWSTHPTCSSLAPTQAVDTPADTFRPLSGRKEMKSVIIKATYREDIIRIRISVSFSIVNLKEEVAKRLKLEVGTFDMKYLDDDHEWVLVACDADLQECMDIARSSGSNVIRLSIQDTVSNLGSSCESSGG